MISFDLTDEQRMLRDAVARYVREHHTLADQRRAQTLAGGFDRARWKAYAEFGWLGLALPEDAGGLGCSMVEVAIVMEEFGRGLAVEPFLAASVLCGQIVSGATGWAGREPTLESIASGVLVPALAHTEKGASETPATIARRVDGGWRLDGVKLLTIGAPAADRLIVSATVPGEPGFALFAVDPRARGVTMSRYTLLDASAAADVRFENVAIDASECMLASDRAPGAFEHAIDLATLGAVAQALGAMETVLDLTGTHLKTRVQFGQALARFQALQHRMVEMWMEVEATRSILLQGLDALETDDVDAHRAAISAAKAYAATAARFVGQQGIQLHGGIGVTDELAVGHYVKRLVMLEKLFGDADRHLDRFARAVGY